MGSPSTTTPIEAGRRIIQGPDSEALAAIRSVTGRTQGEVRVEPDKIVAFLSKQRDIGGQVVDVVFDTSRRSSGASSGTQLLEAVVRANGAERVLPLAFRYDLGGKFFLQYDLIAQFRIMKALLPLGIPVPHALWLDAEGEIAGKPGLFMKRVDAPAPGGQPFAEGPIATASPKRRREMVLASFRAFADLHTLDAEDERFSFLNARGRGDHFILRAIDWDTRELLHAIPEGFGGDRTAFYDDVRSVMLRARDHLISHAPLARRAELAHGDTNLSNVMFRGTEVAALLDWELCHLGLGEGDVGYCQAGISHFLRQLPPMDGIPTEAEMIAAYRSQRGKAEDLEYGRLWGEWRLGVYQVMAYSRFPSSLRHVEEGHWDATRNILGQFVA